MASDRRRLAGRTEIDQLVRERSRVDDRQLCRRRAQADGQLFLVGRQPQRIRKSKGEHILEGLVFEIDDGQHVCGPSADVSSLAVVSDGEFVRAGHAHTPEHGSVAWIDRDDLVRGVAREVKRIPVVREDRRVHPAIGRCRVAVPGAEQQIAVRVHHRDLVRPKQADGDEIAVGACMDVVRARARFEEDALKDDAPFGVDNGDCWRSAELLGNVQLPLCVGEVAGLRIRRHGYGFYDSARAGIETLNRVSAAVRDPNRAIQHLAVGRPRQVIPHR